MPAAIVKVTTNADAYTLKRCTTTTPQAVGPSRWNAAHRLIHHRGCKWKRSPVIFYAHVAVGVRMRPTDRTCGEQLRARKFTPLRLRARLAASTRCDEELGAFHASWAHLAFRFENARGGPAACLRAAGYQPQSTSLANALGDQPWLVANDRLRRTNPRGVGSQENAEPDGRRAWRCASSSDEITAASPRLFR